MKFKFGSWKIYFIITLLMISGLILIAEEVNEIDDTFYFVQISDSHIGKGTNLEITNRLIEQINALPMDIQFIIHTGDIVQYGLRDTINAKKAAAAFSKLEKPIYFIPGNHDIYPEYWETETGVFQKYFGELMFTKEFDNIAFVGLFTDPIAYSFSVDGYEPFEEIETALKKIKDKPIIVFHHIPSVGFFYNNTMHDGWQPEDKTRWQKLLNSFNVKAIIAGHFHSSEQHWIGDVPLHVPGSVTNRFGRQPSFRIYEYKDGKLGYRTQYEQQ